MCLQPPEGRLSLVLQVERTHTASGLTAKTHRGSRGCSEAPVGDPCRQARRCSPLGATSRSGGPSGVPSPQETGPAGRPRCWPRARRPRSCRGRGCCTQETLHSSTERQKHVPSFFRETLFVVVCVFGMQMMSVSFSSFCVTLGQVFRTGCVSWCVVLVREKVGGRAAVWDWQAGVRDALVVGQNNKHQHQHIPPGEHVGLKPNAVLANQMRSNRDLFDFEGSKEPCRHTDRVNMRCDSAGDEGRTTTPSTRCLPWHATSRTPLPVRGLRSFRFRKHIGISMDSVNGGVVRGGEVGLGFGSTSPPSISHRFPRVGSRSLPVGGLRRALEHLALIVWSVLHLELGGDLLNLFRMENEVEMISCAGRGHDLLVTTDNSGTAATTRFGRFDTYYSTGYM